MPERIEIGIIPHDTRHEETIIQIANTLDNLQLAVTHVFQSIDERISGYSKRLSIVKNKANKLQDQLHYLQTNLSLKATKMYSDAKYPAFSTYKEYETIIKMLPANVTKSQGMNEKSESPSMVSENCRSNHAVKDDHWVGEANLQDKLQFYYVMGKPLKKTSWPEQDDNHFVSQASSISALLLADVEKGERPSQLPTIISNATQIEDAPDSIIQPWNSIDFESPSYLYAPALGEVPQINVPPTLPDLPGIVDDEKFTLDLSFQSPIAPSSAVTTPTVRINLPDTNENRFGIIGMSENAPKLPDVTDDSSSTGLANAPPPPPPIAHPAEETLTNVSGKMETNQQPSIPPTTVLPPPPPPPPPTPPPPPPPPPPSSSEPEGMVSQSKEQKPIKKKNIPPVDDRTDLMAAIRAAGGVGKAKLRNAAAAEKPADRWSSASVGGDLMADLHAKLSLRRKGIAGSSMPAAMERISRLIPPPPKANEASASDRNSATSEYDSQPDVDDWEE